MRSPLSGDRTCNWASVNLKQRHLGRLFLGQVQKIRTNGKKVFGELKVFSGHCVFGQLMFTPSNLLPRSSKFASRSKLGRLKEKFMVNTPHISPLGQPYILQMCGSRIRIQARHGFVYVKKSKILTQRMQRGKGNERYVYRMT